MLSGQDLAQILLALQGVEGRIRHEQATEADMAERDALLVTGRHVIAARKSVEAWVATRVTRSEVERQRAVFTEAPPPAPRRSDVVAPADGHHPRVQEVTGHGR